MLFMRSLAFLLCLITAAGQEAPEQPASFQAGVTQVRVDVLVRSGKGYVQGLTREDFVVTDNGKPVPVGFLGKDDDALNVLLLLDVSGSMSNYLEQVGKRARAILGQLREQDQVAVMIFAREADYIRPFTPNKDRAASAIDQALRPGLLPSGTSINAALLDAGDAFLERKTLPGHRAILILTDSRGLNYRVPDDLVLQKLFSSDAVLNAVVTKNAEPPKPPKPGVERNPDFTWADVFKLSAETGGETLRTDRADEAFAELLESLRYRYLLAYNAPADSAKGFRRIEVTLSKAAQKKYGKVVIRARTGYYTGS
jgi:VWFA-related protein